MAERLKAALVGVGSMAYRETKKYVQQPMLSSS